MHVRQLSLSRVLLETNSQNRARLEIFPRGCFFCTYPTWEAPVELATSCMSDKWQALDESADMAGDFTLQVAIPVSALTAAGSGSSSGSNAGLAIGAGKRQWQWRFLPPEGAASIGASFFFLIRLAFKL